MNPARPSAIRADAGLRIGRAQLHGAVAADRDRLLVQLDSVRPSAVGVPERAILFVPRLVAGKRLPRQGDGGLFAAHVADALRAALRRARRPGEPGSADDPLLFLDESEAAAVLIGQWLEGAPTADRRWWPLLTGGAAPPLWWRRRLLPDARRLPAIVAGLARRGLAAAWLRRLEPAEIETAVAAMAETHGLKRREWRRRRLPVSSGPGGFEPAIAHALALVDSVAPEARQADLPAPARLLLILALVAERRPALLGTRAARVAFAAAAAEAWPLAAQPPAPRFRQSRPPTAAAQGRRRPPAPGPDADPPRAPGAAPAAPIAVRAATTAPAAAAGHDAAPVAPGPENLPTPAGDRSVPPFADAIAPADEFDTDFGGLLFLLNALLALGLYGDFSRPGHAVAGLSPFGMLRLLGRAWFGAPFVSDPLHGLLARLAGGRGADSARDFEARRWSVPRAWLAPWPDGGPALVAGSKRRPMLWHPAGFPLAELDGGNPGAAVRAARRLGLRRRPDSARFPALPVPPRARWLACLRLYLEARIARALGCGGGIEAVTLLCRRSACISAGGERVEARFALEHHPLAIRLAGLDRDPGWIPAAGRDFRYIFE